MNRRITIVTLLIITAALPTILPAQITVPPGFVVDTLLPQIDGQTPRLEAISNPAYGSGVIAASVDNGILTIRKISPNNVEFIGTLSGFDPLDIVRQVKFDYTGLYNSKLYISISVLGVLGETSDTHIIEVSSQGSVIEKANYGNASTNSCTVSHP